MADKTKKLKENAGIEFRDVFTIIFSLLSFGLVLTGIWLIAESTLPNIASAAIASAIANVWTLMTLVVQFYFRKKPTEKDN
jgi:FtsH-binding integral membrane protein